MAMKRLYVLLFTLVFISLIGMGWGIDAFYQSLNNQNKKVLPQSEAVILSYRDFLDGNNSNLEKLLLPEVFQIEPLEQFLLPKELNQQLLNGDIVILNSEEGVSLHVRLTSQSFVLSMGPLKTIEVDAPWLKYILTAMFYSGIAIILMLWFKPLLMAVMQLSQALKNIAKGKLETRVDYSNLYLDVLFDDFNQMAKKLEILNENNQLFSQAVSHDIRTPLSRIMFALEKINNHKDKDVKNAALSISSDVKKIESLSKELLEYSRLEKHHQLKRDEIDVTLLIEQVIAGFDYYKKAIKFNTNKIPSNIYLDVELLQKIVNNLVSNAVRYCHSDVRIEAEFSNDELLIIVEDDGEGIDINNKTVNEFCQPFIQQERSDKHFGLGLAIVNRAIKLMQGELVVDNASTMGGARFKVIIPISIHS